VLVADLGRGSDYAQYYAHSLHAPTTTGYDAPTGHPPQELENKTPSQPQATQRNHSSSPASWFGTRRPEVRILSPRPYIFLESFGLFTAEGLVLSAVSLHCARFCATPSLAKLASRWRRMISPLGISTLGSSISTLPHSNGELQHPPQDFQLGSENISTLV
jgi:hypothetical protein